MNKLQSQKELIHQTLRNAHALGLSLRARQRLHWFVFALENMVGIVETCQHFGIARSTFEQWLERFDPQNPKTLEDLPHRPKNVRKPETPEIVIELIRQYRQKFPTMGKERIQELLSQEHGITSSLSTIGRVISRNGFYFADTDLHRRKRAQTPVSMETGHHEQVLDDIRRSIHLLLHPLPPFAYAYTSVLPTIILVLITAIASFVALPEQAHADQSASYKLYQTVFPGYATGTPSTSTNYKVNDNGIHWNQTPLVGTTFQISNGPTAPAISSSSSSSSSSSAVADTDDARGSGGGRGNRTGAPDTYVFKPSVPGEQPEPPVVVTPKPTPEEPTHAAPEEPAPTPVPAPQPVIEPEAPTVIVRVPVAVKPTRAPTGPTIIVHIPEFMAPAAPELPGLLTANAGYLIVRAVGISMLLLIIIILTLTFLMPLTNDGAFVVTQKLRVSGAIAARKKTTKKKKSGRTMLSIALIIMSGIAAVSIAPTAYAVTSVPNTHVYNGHLLDASGNAVTTSVEVRFSFWTSADLVAGDITGGGAINTGASAYGGWFEEHTLTPDGQGYFSVQLGSSTSLPAIDSQSLSSLLNRYLQVEVKSAAAADTSYENLDPNTGSSTVDRSPVLSVPFTQNADFLDKRDTGTGSGNIAVLLSGGLLPVSTIPDATNRDTFTIDENDTVGSGPISLIFGNSLNERISFNTTTSRFDFSDDLNVIGNMSGASLRVSNLSNCNTIDTDASGNFVCGADAGGGFGTGNVIAISDPRYVNTSGDTMTGNLIIANGAGLAASGAIRTDSNLTINDDLGAVDAILTFGSDVLSETLRFLNLEDRFEFSDDLAVTGNLTSSGTLTVDGNAATKADLTINSDNGAADAILTFGNDAGAETLRFSDTTNAFVFSDDLTVQGQLSGSSLSIAGGGITFSDAAATIFNEFGFASNFRIESDTNANMFFVDGTNNRVGVGTGAPEATFDVVGAISGATLRISSLSGCNTIDTDASGNFVCGSDAGGSFGTGNVIAISDPRYVNTAGDTMTGALSIINAAGMTASGSIRTDGNLEASGSLVIEGTAAFNGVQYTFPNGDGSSSGKVLQTNSAGILGWGSAVKSATFTDSTTESINDANEDLWDGTYPNISPESTAKQILISVIVHGSSDSADDEYNAFTIRRAVGANPVCTDTTVGNVFAGAYTTNTASPFTSTATFIDSPSSTGNVRYTVCSDTAAEGTVSNDTSYITVTLSEIGG